MSTLKINFQEGDLPSLHPHDLIVHLRGISLSKSLFEGLTRVDAEGKAHLAGAESMEVTPDRLRYTFLIRDNHWSDGTPVTASQYERAWKSALSPQSTCARSSLLYILKNGEEAKRGQVPIDAIGVHAEGPKKLVVELAYPSPFFLELLAQPICAPLLDPENKQVTAFNGPFTVDTWDRNLLLRLKPNPHFWNRSQVRLKQIDISMMQDIATVYASFESRAIDWIGAPISTLSAEQSTYLKKEGKLHSHPVDRTFWVFLNTEHPALASPRIRQALSMAIDRTEVTRHILVSAQPLSKPFPPTLLASNPTHAITEDLQTARRLFQEGLADLGLTPETFPPLAVSFAHVANRKQFAEYLRERWKTAFGIEIRLDMQEWNSLRAKLDQGQFEVAGCTEAAYYKDPIEVLERFVTRNPGNFSQWINPVFTQKIATAKQEKDLKKRNVWVAQAEQILLDEMPFIPICSDCFLFAHSATLKGYVFDSLGALDFSYASQ